MCGDPEDKAAAGSSNQGQRVGFMQQLMLYATDM
jgi:hypothetical protein